MKSAIWQKRREPPAAPPCNDGSVFSIIMKEVLDDNRSEYCLPAAAHRLFYQATFGFLATYTSLCQFYHPQGIWLFNFTPKFHYLAHIAHYSSYIRAAWCYAGEGYISDVMSFSAPGLSHRGAPLEPRFGCMAFLGPSWAYLGPPW